LSVVTGQTPVKSLWAGRIRPTVSLDTSTAKLRLCFEGG
jgi:hypothetical protein